MRSSEQVDVSFHGLGRAGPLDALSKVSHSVGIPGSQNVRCRKFLTLQFISAVLLQSKSNILTQFYRQMCGLGAQSPDHISVTVESNFESTSD